MARLREDIICHSCKREEASYLFFWRKIYLDMGEAILDPSLICETCKQKFIGSSRLFERQPVIISFRKLAEKDANYIGWLLSDKKRACNHLSSSFWRRKVWRVRYLGRRTQNGNYTSINQSI